MCVKNVCQFRIAQKVRVKNACQFRIAQKMRVKNACRSRVAQKMRVKNDQKLMSTLFPFTWLNFQQPGFEKS